MSYLAKIVLSSLVSLCVNVTFAAGPETANQPPCLVVKKACDSAGLHKAKDCFKKVMSGEKVTGVTIQDSVLSQCKDKN